MKSIRYITFFILSAMLLGACEDDFLTETNPNAPTAATFWQTDQDAVKATNAVYESMTYEGMYMRMMHAMQDIRSDDATGDSPWIELSSPGNFTVAATNAAPQWVWRDAYHGVYRANQVIQYVPGIDMDSALRDRLVGEAKFLRAFYYFHLVKMFENVPLIIEPATSPDDYLQAQAPAADVWAQIVTDLTEAQAVLPQSYAQDIGRATWGAATTYLGVAHLFNANFNAADVEFKRIIDSGLYRLVADPRHNGGYENENNEESIFEIQFSRDVGGTENGWAGAPAPTWGETHARSITYAPQGFGWADVTPSRGLYQTFQEEKTVDGEDDPRLHATMFYNRPGMTIYGRNFQEFYADNPDQIFWRKYESDIPGGDENDQRSGINIRVMRYADVLLMYAETQNELGNQAEAARRVQEARDRANLPDRQAEFAALSQSAMRDRIAHERFLELAGEGKRFDDVRRWGWLDDPNKIGMMCENDPEFCGYAPGDEWLPIPQTELDTNPLLEQNQGY